jgi:hypothetical protein
MPEGTLYAAVVQPKMAHHANILSIDTSEAEKMPGRKQDHHLQGSAREEHERYALRTSRAPSADALPAGAGG